MADPSVSSDGERSPHPAAFAVLYEAFRNLDCTTALDPADADDCSSVADEAIRALQAAGLLATFQPEVCVEPEGQETRDPAAEAAEQVLRIAFAGGSVPDESLARLADVMAAVIRPVVAEGIAAACGAMAAKAPRGYGLDHNGGQVVGYLGAGRIARRHAKAPPLASVDETALNAAYLRGQRSEQERIAHQIERALPDSEARRVALEITRDRYYLLTRKNKEGERGCPSTKA